MKRKNSILLTIAMIISSFASAVAGQYPMRIELPSDGSIWESAITDTSKTYIIEVQGTYSMWSQFTECYGVDAAYVYDVPKEEIDNLRWPPQEIEVLGTKIEICKLPHWVGDPYEYTIPPKQISLPFFKMNFRGYKGFRIDNEPLSNTGYQSLTHYYTVTKKGTGQTFKFQILDSNRSIVEERTIPRYEDNCGKLKVTITEKGGGGTGTGTSRDTIIRIGDVHQTVTDDGHGITELEVGVYDGDGGSGSGGSGGSGTGGDGIGGNILEGNIDDIIIIDNGKIVCDIDSIVCNKRSKPLAIGLLIDNTESMQSPISEQDPTNERMTASKNALTKFVEEILPQDETFLMSFNEDTKTEQAWTNDISKLKTSISAITSEDKLTAVFKAIGNALDTLSINANANKALIVLSDGGNTFPPTFEESAILAKAQQKNIPIYNIALGFTNKPIDIDGLAKLGSISSATKGQLFSVYNAKQLDSVYQKLITSLTTDEDCYVYFKSDTCKPGEERWIRVMYAPNDSTIITKVMKYKCPDKSSTPAGVVEFNTDSENRISLKVQPNPFSNISTLSFDIKESKDIAIEIHSIDGRKLFTISEETLTPGLHSYSIDGMKLGVGTYVAVVKTKTEIISKKIIVIR